jgi:hypothetical protein
MFENLFISSKQERLERLQRLGLPIYDEDAWWVSLPERAETEIAKMQRFSNSVFTVDGDSLVWHFNTTTNFGNTYLQSIVTDSGFPFKQPKTYVLEPQIKPSDTIHMYGGGELCLFRPEEYHSNLSILDLRNKSCAWCFAYDTYINTGEWGGAEAPH